MNIKTDGTLADVQAKINAAPDDGSTTVIIPPGTHNWNGQLTLHKAVDLKGEEGALLRHNGNATMIHAWSGDGGHTTISGLRLVQVSDVGGGKGYLMIAGRREGSSNTVRIHDCVFDQNGRFNWAIQCQSNGILIWNSRFIGSGTTHGMGGIQISVGSPDRYDLWRRPLTLGTKDTTGLGNVYVEDCHFSNASIGCAAFSDNARLVWRHNTMQDAGIGSHGQEAAPLGASSFEIYNNTFRISANNPQHLSYWVHVRGGTGVITGNLIDLVPWDGGSQFLFSIMSITRGANDNRGGLFCPIEYPAPRQIGWSWADNNANWGRVRAANSSLLEGGNPGFFIPNGRGAILDPVYIWDNSGPGSQANTLIVLRRFEPDHCGNNQRMEDYFQRGRDFFVNAGPKPGWTPYTYPHPLRQSSEDGGDGGGSGGNATMIDYSIEEQDTGLKWIDGRSVYQKTVRIPALPNNATAIAPHGIVGLDFVISLSGSARGPLWIALPHFDTSQPGVMIWSSGSNISVRTARDFSAYTEGQITLVYVKR